MSLLCKKGAHGDSARCEQVCVLLPQRSQGSTLKNHMLLIAKYDREDQAYLSHLPHSVSNDSYMTYIPVVYHVKQCSVDAKHI